MRVFLGMVIGAALTVSAAFVHDLMATSPVAAGEPNAVASRTLVNWDVVKSNLRVIDDRARQGWTKLSNRF